MTFGRYCEAFLAHGLRCKGVPCLSSKSPVAHAGVDDMIGPRPPRLETSILIVRFRGPKFFTSKSLFNNGIGGSSKLMEVA